MKLLAAFFLALLLEGEENPLPIQSFPTEDMCRAALGYTLYASDCFTDEPLMSIRPRRNPRY